MEINDQIWCERCSSFDWACTLCWQKQAEYFYDKLEDALAEIESLNSQFARARGGELLVKKPDGQGRAVIYTDGGCAPTNPGPGGWGAVVKMPDASRHEFSGGEKATTNNRMELTATIVALDKLTELCSCHGTPELVEVVTDSRYVSDAFRKNWLENWKRTGWTTAGRGPVKNKDLWERLDKLTSKWEIRWRWVKGHSGDPENERCDDLSAAARATL